MPLNFYANLITMTLRIVQISDTHLSAGFPQRTIDLQRCIQQINEIEPQPDLVIHTGDVSHDGLAEEYNTASRLLDTLRVPYFVLAGNRDNRSELLKVFSDGEHLQPDSDWIQYSVERYATRILVIDTVSTESNKGRFCAQRLEMLRRALDADTSKPSVLFMHHAPFEASEIPDPFQFEDWKEVERLAELLAKYNMVEGIYCGHVHRNIDSTLGSIKASALTCLAGDLRKGRVTDAERELPVFKVLDF